LGPADPVYFLIDRPSAAWAGTNGAAPKGGKQTTKDVEAYFKINDVKKLVSMHNI
jgi:hypothetical protein